MKIYTKEEQYRIADGISEDGVISKESEEAIRAAIAEGRAEGLLMGEIKRRLRDKLADHGVPGKKVADAVDKLR